MLVPGSAELTQSPSRGPGISGRNAMLTIGLLSGLAVTSVGSLMAFRSPVKATKENSRPAPATTAMLTKAAESPTPVPPETGGPVLAAASASVGAPQPPPEAWMNETERTELRNSVAEVVKGMDKATISRLLMNLPKKNVDEKGLQTLIAQLPTQKQPHAHAMVLAVALYPKELPALMQTLKSEMEANQLGFATGVIPITLSPADHTDMVKTARAYWVNDSECDEDLRSKLRSLPEFKIETASVEKTTK